MNEHVGACDHGIELRWCFDIPGPPWMSAADVTLDVALKQRPDGLISFGSGGPETEVSRGQFASHFAAARAAGLRSVPHAGESTGRRPSGTRYATSARNASATASPPPATEI